MGHAEFHGRREDGRLVTGHGRYTSDVSFEGQLYAHFVRADRAHATIRGIDTAAAKAHPGVVAVYTAADTGVMKPQGTAVNWPGRDGKPIIIPPRQPFATDRVRFVGQEVALVVAETPGAAQDAAELVAVDYDDLPAIASIAAARRPGAQLVHDEAPGNVVFDWDYGDAAATEATFASAQHVVKLRIESQRVNAVPMEPRACVVRYDAADGVYHVYVTNQGMAGFRPGLALNLGVAPDKIHVHAQDVGGGFGARTQASADHACLAWAAKQLNRPIKWTASRTETFQTEFQGRGIEIEGELAFNGDGTILAMRTLWHCDQGAYLTGAGPMTNTTNGYHGIGGVYRMKAAYGRHLLYVTNMSPHAPYRGAGRPEAAYIVERLVDEAAAKLGMDRAEIRRKNLIPKDAYPYKNPAGCEYDSGDVAALLDRALELSQWKAFPQRLAESRQKGLLRGIGLATFVEPSGGGGAPKDQVAVRIQKDGEVLLHSASQSHGQSHETVFPRILAQTLGIPESKVRLVTDHAVSRTLMGNPVVGSRSIMLVGSAYKLAAIDMVKKGTQLAAKKLEAAPDDIEFGIGADGTGAYSVKGTDRRVTMATLIAENAGGETHPLDANAEHLIQRAFPTGAHVAEVEIDPATGVTSLLRYIAVDDCGVVMDHTLAAAQLHGALMQGVGQIFGEHCMYDAETGQLLTGSFMDYFMPRAGLVGEIVTDDINVPSPTNTLGAKGVGEAGCVGSLPTVMNAIVDALRPLGIHHFDMPATPARVWAAIRNAHK